MKNLMKRSAAAVLALIMCVSMLNLTAFAAESGDKCPYCRTGTIVEGKTGNLTCDTCADFEKGGPIPTEPAGTDKPECTHTLTSLQIVSDTKHEGVCTKCGEWVIEEHTADSYQYDGWQCKCGYNAKGTPVCDHDWQYSSNGYGTKHALYCPKCYMTEEEECSIVKAPEGYSMCTLCGWNDKDIVLSDVCLKCGAKDHKADDCPNWCAICDQPYILAQCGGKYCSVNGQAAHIQKGTACQDNMNGFGNGNVHDHQCDYCHAHHLDCVRQEVTATCTEDGKTIVKCGYPGCNYVESETYTSALGHTFDKADVSDNCDSHNDEDCDGHTLTCSRCGGKEGKDAQGQEATKTENHTYNNGDAATVDGVEGIQYTCSTCGHQYFEANSEAETHTLTILYRYVDENGEVAGDEGQVAEPYVGSYKEGEVYSVESPDAPAGYARETGMETVTGKMPAGPEYRTVKYEIITYTQTIIYKYENGNEINRVERKFTVKNRDTLETVKSPVFEGYTADKAEVGRPEVLDDDKVIVTYTANSVPTQPTESTQPTQPIPTPTPEPSEPVEIDEPETPLGPLPELPEEPEEPVEIDEPETPLGPLPELPEQPEQPELPDEVEVEDPDVPLAAVPQTGDNTVLWATTAVASGAGLIWLAVDGKKRREDAE